MNAIRKSMQTRNTKTMQSDGMMKHPGAILSL